VQSGLDYLFSVAQYDAVNHWVWWEVGSSFHNVYMTGPCLLPIVRSGAPDAVVSSGPLNGLTYKQVAQYTVDWLGSAQVPSGTNTGAWYYNKGFPTTDGDQSVVGWVCMGLGYAVHSMGCTLPDGLLTRLSQWNTYIQCKTPGDSFNGAGYTAPCSWVNSYKTGGLLFDDALCGNTQTTPRVVDALSFLDGYWNDPTNGHDGAPDAGWRGASPPTPTSTPRPSYLATLSITKGMTELGIVTFSGHNWYDDFAEVIVRTQHTDKSWTGGGWEEENCPGRSTCWALMTLLKAHSTPAPTITEVNPNSGTPGQCLTIIITGNGFTGATAVDFGPGITVNSFRVDNGTQITADICIAADAASGASDVSVTTHGGTGKIRASFTVKMLPAPEGHRVSPSLSSRPFNPAQFSIQYVTFNPQQTSAGQPVTITLNVVNTGDEAGNYNVPLKINGKMEQSKMVSVDPQGTQPVKFTVTKAQPGTYTVDIGGQSGSFVVLGANRTAGASVNGGLIVFLIMSVLILATIVVLLASRRTA
jgi:hypothetical protein